MCKYLIWCFINDTRIEKVVSTEKKALKIYNDAISSGEYSSVVLGVSKRTHGYAIKRWAKEDGEEVFYGKGYLW